MSAEKNWQFELEEYIKQGEPDQIEKSEAWQAAIGLQAVDGLKTSAYLLDTRNISKEKSALMKRRNAFRAIMSSVLIAQRLRTTPRKRILCL